MTADAAMTRRVSLGALVILLMAVGLGQSLHRHFVYEVPWLPGADQSIWSKLSSKRCA